VKSKSELKAMELEEINIGVDKNSVDSRPLLDKHDPTLQVKVS